MNPNQMPPYQQYSGQYNKPVYQNYQPNNNQQLNQNINNMANNQFQTYQSNQSNQYIKNQLNNQNNNYSLNRNKLDKAMYTSSIEPSTNNNNKNFTFGKLQSMGRFVTSTNTTEVQGQRKINDPNSGLGGINYMTNNMNNINNLTNNNNNFNNIASNQTSLNQHITSQQKTSQQFYQGSTQTQNQNPSQQQFLTNNVQNNSFSRQQKSKMFQSYIAPSSQPMTQFDRFPAFNLQSNNHNQENTINGLNNNNNSQNSSNNQNLINETPEQKRRRQILAIKQQLELINKKMESNNFNKKYTNNNNNTNESNSTNNDKLSNNIYNSHSQEQSNSNISQNSTTINSSFINSDTSVSGLSFNRNLHNNHSNNERNKGLIAQSMIVSTQSSSGYKFQSIFDKYDSMKKPTYETYQTNLNNQNSNNFGEKINSIINKETKNQNQNLNNNLLGQNSNSKSDSPLLLDQFVKKGNNVGSSNNITLAQNISKQKQYKKNISNLINNNSSLNTNLYTNLSSSNSINIQTKTIQPQPLNMFKKKKDSLLLADDIQNQINQPKFNITSIITSPKNNHQGGIFKKTKQYSYQDNIVTSAMKKMKIQESIQFTKNDFAIGKKLGKGQFGQVMLVQHKKTGFLCGMKVMQKKQIREEKYQNQIARQLSIQFYLSHRNIAPLYGYFQDQKNVYLLVQYCTGGQLLQMLRKNRRMQQPEVSRIIKQIIEGIDYIHKELIIHRDIKPQNILFNFGVAKICDFGWAVYKGHGMRKTASVGSPLYYSPQIVMGVQYDQKIDIWDIGMMTYQCLLGKIPFRIYSQLDLNRIVQDQIKFPEYIDTTDEAKDFILKIMKKKPEQRMQIREMLRHPFITKYQDQKLAVQIMKDFKQVLSF